MRSIKQWLADLGLDQYSASFEAHDVDLNVLPALTETDLQNLGVSLGHRKRMLLALHGVRSSFDAAANEGLRATALESLTAEGERRHVTVLMCDLVGSTALSNRLDPEEYRAILARYHETCIGCVQRFEGFVAQIQGDGVVAYFGYPLAHEGEAERAIRAALAIVQTLPDLDVGLEHALRVRIGVASGLVVVSHVLAPEKSAVGETPNLAQRLQTLAQPGEVMANERTRALASGAFEYEDSGLHSLKGIAQPTRVWKVLGPSGATTRFDASTRGRVTPMVGRQQEIALLQDRWQLSRSGKGQVVLVQGEPGIGKSRMLSAFRQHLGERIQIALQYQCSPYYTNSAFYPIADHLERTLGFQRDDSVEQKIDKIEHRLIDELGRSRSDCHLLARALSIPGEDRYGILEMSPQRQKDETIALLVEIVAVIAARQATVVLFEDAHWADPSTIEVLNALVARSEKLSLLVLITYRPEFEPSSVERVHVTRIGLQRLTRVQGAGIVLRVANDKPLPAELVGQIVDKTDGVPLFLEELTKTVLESDLLVDIGGRYDYSGAVSKLSIPATLRDSLAARLDRLIPVKEIAQIGAVVGREFSYELVRAVSPMSEDEFRDALDRLTGSELVYRRGTPPDAIYTFKHALVRDAAYDSLLITQRQLLHAQIASAINERFPSKANTEPELLAQHYTEGCMLEVAIPFWQKAGELAQKRVAIQEAIGHFERGLEVTMRLAPSRQRDRWELQLRALLGIAWVELHGYTHPQVAAQLEPALALDQSLDDGDYTLRILWGLWVYTLCTGRVENSLPLAERLIAMAEDRDSESMRLGGHWAACDSHYFLGNFARCVHHADIILSRYDAERDRVIADLINHDPKTIALAYKAAAQWRLGFFDRATASVRSAIANARERKHVFDFCWVHTFLAQTILTDSGDTETMDAFLQEAERISKDQKLAFFTQIYCPLSRAFWLLRCHRAKEAEAALRRIIPDWQTAGMEIFMPSIKVLHAESLLLCGKINLAMALVDEALELIKQPGRGERGGLSNVLRIKACALREAGNARTAEKTFQEALSIAREQSAKFWELCAAVSYARLLKEQSRFAEALDLLQPVYDWFTEGQDTRALQEAAALLNELGHTPSRPAILRVAPAN